MKNDNANDNENDNENKDGEREDEKHIRKIITIMGRVGPSNLTTRGGSPSQRWVLTGVKHAQPEFGRPPARRRSERAGGLASPGCAQLCWQVGPRAAKRGMYSRSMGVARASVG